MSILLSCQNILAMNDIIIRFSAFSAMPENAGDIKTRFAIHFFAGGLRRVIADFLKKLGAVESIEQILKTHPKLTREHIQVALLFAAKALRSLKDTL